MARPDPPQTYRTPEAHLELRERARVLYALVLLVPAADQGEALASS